MSNSLSVSNSGLTRNTEQYLKTPSNDRIQRFVDVNRGEVAPDSDDLLALDNAMKLTLLRTDLLAKLTQGLIITGASGSLKLLLARYIHSTKYSTNLENFIVFDPLVCNRYQDQHHDDNAASGIYRETERQRTLTTSQTLRKDRLQKFAGIDEALTVAVSDASGGTLVIRNLTSLSDAMQLRVLAMLGTGAELGAMHLSVASSADVSREARIILLAEEPLANLSGLTPKLFNALRPLEIKVPTLNETPERLEQLAKLIIFAEIARQEKKIGAVTQSALDVIKAAYWPGNFDQLQTTISMAVTLSGSVLDANVVRPFILEDQLVSPAKLGATPNLAPLSVVRPQGLPTLVVPQLELQETRSNSEGEKTEQALSAPTASTLPLSASAAVVNTQQAKPPPQKLVSANAIVKAVFDANFLDSLKDPAKFLTEFGADQLRDSLVIIALATNGGRERLSAQSLNIDYNTFKCFLLAVGAQFKATDYQSALSQLAPQCKQISEEQISRASKIEINLTKLSRRLKIDFSNLRASTQSSATVQQTANSHDVPAVKVERSEVQIDKPENGAIRAVSAPAFSILQQLQVSRPTQQLSPQAAQLVTEIERVILLVRALVENKEMLVTSEDTSIFDFIRRVTLAATINSNNKLSQAADMLGIHYSNVRSTLESYSKNRNFSYENLQVLLKEVVASFDNGQIPSEFKLPANCPSLEKLRELFKSRFSNGKKVRAQSSSQGAEKLLGNGESPALVNPGPQKPSATNMNGDTFLSQTRTQAIRLAPTAAYFRTNVVELLERWQSGNEDRQRGISGDQVITAGLLWTIYAHEGDLETAAKIYGLDFAVIRDWLDRLGSTAVIEDFTQNLKQLSKDQIVDGCALSKGHFGQTFNAERWTRLANNKPMINLNPINQVVPSGFNKAPDRVATSNGLSSKLDKVQTRIHAARAKMQALNKLIDISSEPARQDVPNYHQSKVDLFWILAVKEGGNLERMRERVTNDSGFIADWYKSQERELTTPIGELVKELSTSADCLAVGKYNFPEKINLEDLSMLIITHAELAFTDNGTLQQTWAASALGFREVSDLSKRIAARNKRFSLSSDATFKELCKLNAWIGRL